MIRLNDRESAALAALAQYQKLPIERKHALVNRLGEQTKRSAQKTPLRRSLRSLANIAIGL
jgi:hypothetical protein